MPRTFVRLSYRLDGAWCSQVFRTDDPNWRQAFTALSGSRYNVRIEYVDHAISHVT